jgi:hypothetical protein
MMYCWDSDLRENVGMSGNKVERIFHTLAKAFNGLHWMVGITTLPETASPRQERSFVLMWLGIIVFVVLFFLIMIRLLVS